MKKILLFLLFISFLTSLSYGQSSISQNKLLKYINLFPLTEWNFYGDTLSASTRDSIINDALKQQGDLTEIDTINNTASFEGYGTFNIFQAKDGKDLFTYCVTGGRMDWMAFTTFWQYDPTSNSLKDVTKYFIKKGPAIASFFRKDFSFKGRDTSLVGVNVYPSKDTLTCMLTSDPDPMQNYEWLYSKKKRSLQMDCNLEWQLFYLEKKN